MASFRDLFPSKYLKPDDIGPGKIVVTIAAMRPTSVNQQASGAAGMGGFGEVPGQRGSNQPEVLWALYFREFQKPLKFKNYHGEAIFASLGDDDPARWIGRQVVIYTGTVMFGPTSYEKVLVSPEKVMGQALPPSQQPASPAFGTNAALPPAFDTRGIGIKAADNFRGALAEQGTNTDEYLRWLKGAHQRAYEATFGKDLSDWPHGGVEAMRAFLRDYKTQHPPAGAQPQALPEEDIPF